MSEAEVLTFIHKFSRSVTCEMRVRNHPPVGGEMLELSCEWTGLPKSKHLAPYRQWILSTIQMLVDRWKARVLYALRTAPNRAEFWGFEPGGTPKLLEKAPFGIP